MRRQQIHYLFHLIAYYVAWIGAIMLAARGDAWWATSIVFALVVGQLFWQHYAMHDTNGLTSLIILLTLIGTTFDTVMMWLGLVHFAANPFYPYSSPPWMIAIWVSFAVIFYVTCRALFKRYFLLSVLTIPGFAIAYWVGARLGAANFPYGNSTSILVGVLWGVLLPCCMFAYSHWMTTHD